MRTDKITKQSFIIELLQGLDGKFLTPREIGQKFQAQFFSPRSIIIVEPVKHLHIELRNLAKEGLIQTWGSHTTLRYGISKQVNGVITLRKKFIEYYIQRTSIPIDEWIKDPNRPIVKGIDYRIVQKLNGSFVHLLLYFSQPTQQEKDSTFGTVWKVKPKSKKYPNGKFECFRVD